MHEAFELIRLVDKLPLKICALATWGKRKSRYHLGRRYIEVIRMAYVATCLLQARAQLVREL